MNRLPKDVVLIIYRIIHQDLLSIIHKQLLHKTTGIRNRMNGFYIGKRLYIHHKSGWTIGDMQDKFIIYSSFAP